jgi:hypothetical protein
MIVEPLLHCPVIEQLALLSTLLNLPNKTVFSQSIPPSQMKLGATNPYLALEIHSRRADQIALIVRLLQGRRSLVSHHDRD